MKREHFAFLIGGLAFGVLIGFGTYHAVNTTPDLDQAGQEMAADPRGPRAPTQTGGPNAGGGAPMVARVNELKRMLQQDPENAQVLLALANIYYDAAMWEQAAGYYERVVELEPDPDALTDLGVCYRGLQQFDKALEIFARAHQLDPAHWQSLYNTVVVAGLDLGRVDEARRALDAIEAIEPRPPGLEQARLNQLRDILERAAKESEGRS